MEKEQRNALRKAVEAARRLLEKECGDQLEGIYNILPDGQILDDAPGDPIVRAQLVEVIAHYRAGGADPKEAIDRLRREAAFTTLNRFAALKMAERRGLVRECVSEGLQSQGIRELAECAPGLRAALEDGGYRLLLEAVMDEISLGLKVLFDRRSPTSLLWPRPRALDGLLQVWNDQELAELWESDETIGWIYQYFNADDVKIMRKESTAPRNSHELAVRNQFFTPRYVVEFLVDNTLGRIWYEMRRGETALREKCSMLVFQPGEVFLREAEQPLAESDGADQPEEASVSKTAYVPYRAPRDPRDLRVLDPAVGSGHFLLHAFDILETIYKEAWEDPSWPAWEETNCSLRRDYASAGELNTAIPGLILRHNLYGIEIDGRAAQIAALALWLRAQRTYEAQGLGSADRPAITRSKIVVAEPMPGEEDLLDDFVARLDPPALGDLVRKIEREMRQADEIGSLLKLEEATARAIREAQDAIGPLFVSGETDFWSQAEERLLEALRLYATEATLHSGSQRQLFAEDAAHGIAFLDVCRKQFDAVVMNPPFGRGSKGSESYLKVNYPESGADELCAGFYTRALEFLREDGMLGAISSRTCFYLHSLALWRQQIVLSRSTVGEFVDLGQGILDGATNETAMYVVRSGRRRQHLAHFGMYHRAADKRAAVARFVRKETDDCRQYYRFTSDFDVLDDKPLCYWVSSSFLKSLSRMSPFGESVASVQMGLAPRDEFRFSRLWWEVDPSEIGRSKRWVPYAKGGELSAYYSDVELVLLAEDDLREIKASLNKKYPYLKGNLSWVLHPENDYMSPGLTFGQRTTFLRVCVLPRSCYFSVAGKGIFGKSVSNLGLLQLINTPATQYLASLRRERLEIDPQYQEGDVARMPWPQLDEGSIGEFETMAEDNFELARSIATFDEVDHAFCGRIDPELFTQVLAVASEKIRANEEAATAALERVLELQDQDRRFLQSEIEGRWKARRFSNWYQHTPGDIVQYALGCLFGRWDVRIARDNSLAPELPRIFEEIRPYPPGLLLDGGDHPAGPAGLPLETSRRPKGDGQNSISAKLKPHEGYPLRVAWDGIVTDSTSGFGKLSRTASLEQRVRDVLEVIWPDKSADVEVGLCKTLKVEDLSSYLRKHSGFFEHHLRRYSKSGRKAPIYWPLSTPSGSYTIWLYYPRLSRDMLYRAVAEHVEPLLGNVEERLAQLEGRQQRAGGGDASQIVREYTELAELRGELRDLRAELLRVGELPYRPSMNDGVQITAAPLWRLFQHKAWRKSLEKTWKKLEAGKYDWAHLAYAVWPERVREKCKSDLSVAIAHGLEELYEGETMPGKKNGKKKADRRGGR